MTNEILTVPITYPIISGICSLLVSLFGLFSPFICTEQEFIKNSNWHISLLRGMRIDKLKGFISEALNINENNSSDTRVSYIRDIYECFVDDMEEYIIVDNKIRKCLNKYKIINSSFMLILWFSVATIVASLICKHISVLNPCLNFLFYFSIILVVLQLINILCLRHLCISSQDTYQHSIFKGKSL